MTTNAKSNELKLTRVYDAPASVVWDAWTDPLQVAQWWGPRGFTLTTHSKDLRPGGHWHYTMHGPDGTDYENRTFYHEVEEGAKLVYDHGAGDDRPPLFRVTVLFRETYGKTTMDMTMRLATAEEAEKTRRFIKQAGGNSTWDRLAEYLEKNGSGREKFVIARTFEGPREVVFPMWTDPAHVAQWMPPKGFTMAFRKADIRAGGSSFYSMTNGQVTMYGGADYLEVKPPERLVYTQRFCDENGKTVRHPMSPLWPEKMLTTVEFSPEGPQATRVTLTWEPCEATIEETVVFANARSGMTTGWTGSFDKLEEFIAAGK